METYSVTTACFISPALYTHFSDHTVTVHREGLGFPAHLMVADYVMPTELP